MLKMRLIKGAGAGALDKAAITGLQLVLIPVLTTHWGSSVYGLWLMISAIPALLAFSDLGIATAAGTSMAMDVAAGRQDRAADTLVTAQWAMLALGAIIIAIVACIALTLPDSRIPSVAGYSSFDVRLSVILLALYGVACLQHMISSAGLRSDGQFHIAAIMHTVIYSAESLALMTAVFVGGGPVSAAAALAITRTIGAFALTIFLRHRLPWLAELRGHYRWWIITSLAKPAAAAMAVPAAQMLLSQGATVTLGIAAGAAAVPIFTVSRTLSRIGLQATQVISMTVMPEFSAAAGRQQTTLMANLLVFLTALSLILVVPLGALLALWGEEAVAFWSNDLLEPPKDMILLLAGSLLLTGVWTPISNLLVALNRQAAFAYYFLFLAAVAIPFEFWLATSFGPTGTAVVLLAVDGAMLAVVLKKISRIGVSLKETNDSLSFLESRLRAILRRK